MRHILTLSRSAVIVRHWFEIDLTDCSMEHGARVELRELPAQAHRGSESAAQVITLDRPLWRADLFDRLRDEAGSFGVAHYHPWFGGDEPCDRTWDPALTADPWRWLGDQFASLGAAAGQDPWPLDPEDARELPGLADQVVTLAQAVRAAALRVGRGVLPADPGCPGVGSAHDRQPGAAGAARRGLGITVDGQPRRPGLR